MNTQILVTSTACCLYCFRWLVVAFVRWLWVKKFVFLCDIILSRTPSISVIRAAKKNLSKKATTASAKTERFIWTFGCDFFSLSCFIFFCFSLCQVMKWMRFTKKRASIESENWNWKRINWLKCGVQNKNTDFDRIEHSLHWKQSHLVKCIFCVVSLFMTEGDSDYKQTSSSMHICVSGHMHTGSQLQQRNNNEFKRERMWHAGINCLALNCVKIENHPNQQTNSWTTPEIVCVFIDLTSCINWKHREKHQKEKNKIFAFHSWTT